MHVSGWFRKLFQPKVSPSSQHDNVNKRTKTSTVGVSSKSPSTSSSSFSSSSPGTTSSQPVKPSSALSSRTRFSRKYDVLVCHSCVGSDAEEAGRLVSFLEASHCSLRCFLRERDDCPGSAVSTELCQAVLDSHVWALLITPNFLQDEWCKYMMHQVLAEAPMSNRILPLLFNLPRSHYPLELKFYFYIDLSYNPSRGYSLLNRTVLKYLEDLVKNEETSGCDFDSSSSILIGGDSSTEDNQTSKQDVTETSIQLKVIKENNGSFSDVCDNHEQ